MTLSKLRTRAGLLVGAAAVAATGALTLAPTALAATPASAPAAAGHSARPAADTEVYIWASGVNVHSSPGGSLTGVELGPAYAPAVCQTTGPEATYGQYRNNWWMEIDGYGWISDIFVKGGSNDAPIPGVPNC